MDVAFKRRNISNRIDTTLSYLRNGVNGRNLRTVGLVSTLKTARVAIGVKNALKIEYKRRNISNRSDITHSFFQNRVHDRIFRTGLLLSTPKTGVYCIRRVKGNGNSV